MNNGSKFSWFGNRANFDRGLSFSFCCKRASVSFNNRLRFLHYATFRKVILTTEYHLIVFFFFCATWTSPAQLSLSRVCRQWQTSAWPQRSPPSFLLAIQYRKSQSARRLLVLTKFPVKKLCIRLSRFAKVVCKANGIMHAKPSISVLHPSKRKSNAREHLMCCI